MVDRRDIEQMARLRAILSGEEVPPPSSNVVPIRGASAPPMFLPQPGVVTSAEKEQMARLRSIMTGATPTMEDAPAPRERVPMLDEGFGVMDDEPTDNLLAKFYGASERLAQETKMDRPLRRAMATERTSTGVRVGGWEIAITEGERKTYGVRSVSTGEEIASDLCIYEAAQALVEMLNDGAKINQPEIREILSLEEQYARHLADAVHFRRVLRSGKSNTNRAVLEDRFEQAKTKASSALSRLRRIVEGQ